MKWNECKDHRLTSSNFNNKITRVCFFSAVWKQNSRDGVGPWGEFQALTHRTEGRCASPEPVPESGTASLTSRRRGSYYQRPWVSHTLSANILYIRRQVGQPINTSVNIQQREELTSTERERHTARRRGKNTEQEGSNIRAVGSSWSGETLNWEASGCN